MALNLLEGKGFSAVTLAVAVFALLFAAPALYFAREAVFPPRRRLSIHLLTPARILGHAGDRVEDLDIWRRGRVLEDPYVVTVIVRNTGRHAVDDDQFYRGRPIRINFRVPVALLGSPPEAVAVDDQDLLIGPYLIRQGQELQIQVLTDRAPVLDKDAVSEYLKDAKVAVEIGSYGSQVGVAVRAVVIKLGVVLLLLYGAAAYSNWYH
ncbi:hypothetical protein AB0F68_10380 [Micromonospora sp. NPDC023966]|uniref:hypothetical protein n=1 Tax=Micromonospora sp. NPDC023966 TaxID=3154699 RepID=UPI0033EE61B2